jgi:hypothetical protein
MPAGLGFAAPSSFRPLNFQPEEDRPDFLSQAGHREPSAWARNEVLGQADLNSKDGVDPAGDGLSKLGRD